MKKQYFFLALLMFPFWGLQAQVTETNQTKTAETTVALAKEGTFLLIPTSKVMEVFTVEHMQEVLAWVERNRKEEEEVILTLSIHTDVLIVPRKTLARADFHPFRTLYE